MKHDPYLSPLVLSTLAALYWVATIWQTQPHVSPPPVITPLVLDHSIALNTDGEQIITHSPSERVTP